jgi:amino acid transporter
MFALRAPDRKEAEMDASPNGQGKGLKTGAIGTVSATVIGVASTAPAYSLAATVGLTAAVVGLFSPAIMLVAFIPMLFTASAYYYLNRVDPDCGATFSWVSRAMGPHTGWLAGWGVVVADIVVMPSLAYVAAQYTYSLFGLDSLASNIWAIMGLGCVFILAMTLISWLGIELSARTQAVLLSLEVLILVGFSIFALGRVWMSHPAGSVVPSWSWINPFNLTVSQLSQGVLLALFIYWGWDTAVNVNEETRNGRTAGGIATVASTLILVGTYVVVAFATTAYRGPGFLENNPNDVLTAMVGGWPAKLMILAVLSSAMASTQTTILPTARTTLSMAAHGAAPKALATMSEKYMTPTWSTWWMGIASVAWFVALVAIDRTENVLWDTISGLGFAIAFYYGLTALAAPILFRKHLFKSFKNLMLIGVVPLLGAIALGWVFVKSAIDYWNPVNAYSAPWFAFGNFEGVGAPFVIGIGMLVLGIPLMFWRKAVSPAFFKRHATVAESLTEEIPDETRVGEQGVVQRRQIKPTPRPAPGPATA